MKNKYKSFQGVIKLWCFTKWENCNITCPTKSLICSADVIAVNGDVRIGFVFAFDKTTDFLKQQVINCQKDYDKIYLVVDKKVNDNNGIKKLTDNNIKILSISDNYGFGNNIQKYR